MMNILSTSLVRSIERMEGTYKQHEKKEGARPLQMLTTYC